MVLSSFQLVFSFIFAFTFLIKALVATSWLPVLIVTQAKPPRLYTSKIIPFTRFLFHLSHKTRCKLANTVYYNAYRTMAVFPLMLVRIHDLMEISRVRFSIQTSTVYLRSFTQTRLSTTTVSW